MKKIITYGTFDLLHKGHILLLERARKMGDCLVVGLSTDEFNSIKGKKTYTSYEDRKLLLEALRCVDTVIPEENWEQKKQDILAHEIDTFVMGSDWSGKFDELNEVCEVVYLERTDGISTSKIKQDLNDKKLV